MALPQVATCIIEDELGHVLLLRRTANDVEGHRWCTPGGSLSTQESPAAACLREVQEETGLTLAPASLHLAGTHRLTAAGGSCELTVFRATLPARPQAIALSEEHDACIWSPLPPALPLVAGLDHILSARELP